MSLRTVGSQECERGAKARFLSRTSCFHSTLRELPHGASRNVPYSLDDEHTQGGFSKRFLHHPKQLNFPTVIDSYLIPLTSPRCTGVCYARHVYLYFSRASSFAGLTRLLCFGFLEPYPWNATRAKESPRSLFTSERHQTGTTFTKLVQIPLRSSLERRGRKFRIFFQAGEPLLPNFERKFPREI